MLAILTLAGDLVAEVWRRATTPQPLPPTSVVLAAAAVAVVCLAVPVLWHLTRHLLTLVHEASHGLVAVLTGRRLAGIRLHSDTSGLTVSVGRPTGPGMVATAAAGYLGPAAAGLGAAWLLGAGYAVGLLWALFAAVLLMLLVIRNPYGLVVLLVTLGATLVVTWWAPVAWQVAVAYGVTWFLLLGAPRAVLEMQTLRRRERRAGRRLTSDADALARLTPLPAPLWVAVFWLGCVGALLAGGAHILAAASS